MPPTKKPTKPTAYLVHVGISYPPMLRAEPGDIVSDLPTESIPWLIRSGAISPQED